jgi:hypothetical protein
MRRRSALSQKRGLACGQEIFRKSEKIFMNLIEEHNKKYQFFADITGVAMKVYNKYRPGLLESAYEAALLINFGPEGLFSEWYERYDNGDIEKVRLI